MRKLGLFGLFLLIILTGFLTACEEKSGESEVSEVARPSNSGAVGPAVNLQGNVEKGAEIFKANCVSCHGEEGKTGIDNTGSEDGSVPPLNPIDETMVSKDMKTFATNIDLFIEHGSTPEAKSGETPAVSMPALGDYKTLQPQDIADVIAYVISLNQ